jgi:hypothetical protein
VPAKPIKDYARNKEAFDAIFSRVREFQEWSPISAVNFSDSGRAAPPSAAKPRIQDFLCDVSLVVKKIVNEKYRTRFRIAYECVEFDDPIDQEKWAHKTCGGIRHSWEQRIGAELIRRGIHPYTKYFRYERRSDVRQMASAEMHAKFYSRHADMLGRMRHPWQFRHGRGQQPLVTLADTQGASAA